MAGRTEKEGGMEWKEDRRRNVVVSRAAVAVSRTGRRRTNQSSRRRCEYDCLPFDNATAPWESREGAATAGGGGGGRSPVEGAVGRLHLDEPAAALAARRKINDVLNE